MSRFLNTLFVFLLLFVLVFNSKAQTYPFSNHTVENGLSQGQILSVFQADDGVMWFGTSGGGITKYDGHSYEYITDKDGLADNVVFCIKRGKTGKILIATNNGLSVYDPKKSIKDKTKKFQNYTTKNGLCDNRIFSILIDDNGEAILGTARGLSIYKDGVCSILKIDKKLDSSGVFNLLRDSKKQLWFSTLGNGVFNVDGKTIKNYTTANGLQNNMVFSVMETATNSFWFFTGEGLCELREGRVRKISPTNIDTNATYYSYYKDNTNAIWQRSCF
jgi:ligand-binding sensor domain-containing protein